MPTPLVHRVLFIGFMICAATAVAFASSPEAAAPDADYWTRALPMHPKLVHLPMALCVLMPAVAGLIWVGVRRGWFTPRVWLLAAFLQGATLAGSIGALVSGQDDGAKVEGYASEEALTTHEARAWWFVYVAGANLALCGAAALSHHRPRRQQLLGAFAIVGLCAGGYAGYLVGDAGGRLVYVANAPDAHK
ncbi:MAG: hypothetical protein M3680_11855 [Myxococcota bacterium]|nr:hypothetical protein [Myxococcota bacterium]